MIIASEQFRPIESFDGYVVSREAEIWSVGREVKAKGGATRVTAAKQLKPDEKRRVSLRRDGKTVKVNVDELAAQHFPPTRHSVTYRPIKLHCRWCGHSFGGSITSHCAHDPELVMHPNLFRCPGCTTAVNQLPDYFPTSPYK